VPAVSFYDVPGKQSGPSKRPGDDANLLEYIVAYAKQETLEPIVSQFKALGRGIVGALLMAVGTVLLGLGFLRALQVQFGSAADRSSGHFAAAAGGPAARALVAGLAASSRPNPYGSGHPLSGNWSWVPYMGGALLCLLIAVFCLTRIVKGVSK
jgi:hypothetical protein